MNQWILLTFSVFLSLPAWSQAKLVCTDEKLFDEITTYYGVKRQTGRIEVGACLQKAITETLDVMTIQGLRGNSELLNDDTLVAQVQEDLQVRMTAKIKAEIFEKGLDPNGNPIE